MAAACYIGLFTLLPAFFFPVAVLALAGGLLFGLVRGSIYTFVGALLNCALMFLLARYVGRENIRALIQKSCPSPGSGGWRAWAAEKGLCCWSFCG